MLHGLRCHCLWPGPAMKRVAAIAQIRLLCTQALPGEVVVSHVLSTLRGVIRCHTAVFFWVGADGGIPHIHWEEEVPVEMVCRFGTEFLNRGPGPIGVGFARSVRLFQGVRVLPDWGAGFYRTGFYEAMWRPMGAHHALQASIREHGNGPMLGSLLLYRDEREPAFGDEEHRLLAQAIPYLGHALACQPQPVSEYADTDDEALLVVDLQGRIRRSCERASPLLLAALHPHLAAGTPLRRIEEEWTRWLRELCDRLVRFSRQECPAPPVLRRENARGRFTFRARWLSDREAGGEPQVGVTIRREEPLALRLVLGMRHTPLSPTQQQVALLVALGWPQPEIGRRLGVRPYTVKDHVKAVYDKLGVHDRAALRDRLLGRGLADA